MLPRLAMATRRLLGAKTQAEMSWAIVVGPPPMPNPRTVLVIDAGRLNVPRERPLAISHNQSVARFSLSQPTVASILPSRETPTVGWSLTGTALSLSPASDGPKR